MTARRRPARSGRPLPFAGVSLAGLAAAISGGRNRSLSLHVGEATGFSSGAQRRTTQREVVMTQNVLRISAIALGAAAFASLSPISIALADTTASAPAFSSPADTSALSLAEPAPTPAWAIAAALNGSAAADASLASANEPAPTADPASSPSVATASPSTATTSPGDAAPTLGSATSPSVATGSSTSGATASAAAPSLSEPAPTPVLTESAPSRTAVAAHPRHYAHRTAPHYVWRNGHRYANPVATAANGVVGGVADLGSIAAYPIYCFPNYGSCPVRWYRN